jgi:hypothetical protein
VAGNDENERTVVGNGGKRGWQPTEGLPWPKRSDCNIGGGRGILDLDDKGQMTRGSGKMTGGGAGRQEVVA